MARDNGVKTAYFFQPVPAWGKTLTEEEKRVAGDLSYGDLYRRIVTGMMTLRARGLPMYDLGSIFANERGSIYADHMHYLHDGPNNESRGNRLMAARMGELLSETWGLQRGVVGFVSQREARSESGHVPNKLQPRAGHGWSERGGCRSSERSDDGYRTSTAGNGDSTK